MVPSAVAVTVCVVVYGAWPARAYTSKLCKRGAAASSPLAVMEKTRLPTAQQGAYTSQKAQRDAVIGVRPTFRSAVGKVARGPQRAWRNKALSWYDTAALLLWPAIPSSTAASVGSRMLARGPV